MITQWLAEDGVWTAKLDDWTIEQWISNAPAGHPAPERPCDHETPWTSGGKLYILCTKCGGDEGAAACAARHAAALVKWQEAKPPDPQPQS